MIVMDTHGLIDILHKWYCGYQSMATTQTYRLSRIIYNMIADSITVFALSGLQLQDLSGPVQQCWLYRDAGIWVM